MQYKFSVIVFSILLIFVVIFAAKVNLQSSERQLNDSICDKVEGNVNGLSIYAYTYKVSLKSENLSIFSVILSNISGNLSLFANLNQPEISTVDLIQQSLSRIKQLFNSILFAEGSIGIPQTTAVWDSISDEIQKLTSYMDRLETLTNNATSESVRANIYVVVSMVAVLIAFLIFVYVQIFGRTLKSIDALELIGKKIGGKNQKFRICSRG